jgi:hypothetical protein
MPLRRLGAARPASTGHRAVRLDALAQDANNAAAAAGSQPATADRGRSAGQPEHLALRTRME